MTNIVVLMGRFTDNPELKTTQSGLSVTSFCLAAGSDKTYFIDCVAWRNTAEFICRYFKKGQKAVVTGELTTRSYEDKNGNKRKAVEVVVKSCDFCEKKDDEKLSVEKPPIEQQSFEVINDDQDLPF